MRINDYIHESNLIEGFDSEEADRQSVAAWSWFTGRMRPSRGGLTQLNHDVIRQLQARLVAHQTGLNPWYRGVYRDRANLRVNIGLGEAMAPHLVGRAMEKWLEKLPTQSALKNHVDFEHIHPFGDGNGRTGRMLMWWQQKYLDDLPMTFIANDRKHMYYKWFEDEDPDYSL